MVNTIIFFLLKRRTLNLLNTLSFLVGLLCVYFIIICAPVNVDSAYYLSTSKLIAQGLVPIKDIQMFYTPVTFYILSLPYIITTNPGYEIMLGFMILIKIGGALILYKITALWLQNKQLILFISLNFFLSTMLYEGQAVLLESFVVFFQLLSIYFILKSDRPLPLFFSGVTLALAVLSKQYGLFILPALLVYIIASKNTAKSKISQGLLLLSGFGLIIILFTLYYSLIGVEMNELVSSLSGRSYGLKSISSFINGIVNMLFRNGLLILFIPFMIIANKYIIKDRRFLLIVMALGASFSPLYFQYFGHYFLHILPYIYLLITYIFSMFFESKNSYPRYILVFLFIPVVYCFVLTLSKSVKENIISINGKEKEKQYSTAKLISESIGTKKNIFSHRSFIWPYLCNFEVINAKRVGYALPGLNYIENNQFSNSFLSKNEYFSFIRNANYILVTTKGSPYLEENNLLIDHKKINVIGTEEIWKKNN